jgi:hypothetical protein
LCACSTEVCNASPSALIGYPLFVLLDVAGSYYFAPSFSGYDNYALQYPQFAPGETHVQVLPEFPWPEGVEPMSGLQWLAALTDPEITQLFGEMDTWDFGWGM